MRAGRGWIRLPVGEAVAIITMLEDALLIILAPPNPRTIILRLLSSVPVMLLTEIEGPGTGMARMWLQLLA